MRSHLTSTKKIKTGRSCHSCHIRKVSCDRLVPACTACLRHARTLGQDPATLCCVYASPPYPPSKGPRSKSWRASKHSSKVPTLQDPTSGDAGFIAVSSADRTLILPQLDLYFALPPLLAPVPIAPFPPFDILPFDEELTLPIPIGTGYKKHYHDAPLHSPTDCDSSDGSTSNDSTASESSPYQETHASPKIGSPFHWHFLPSLTWSTPSKQAAPMETPSLSTAALFPSPKMNPTVFSTQWTSPVFTSIFDVDSSFIEAPVLPFGFSEEMQPTSRLSLPSFVVEDQLNCPPNWTYSPGLNLILEASHAFESSCSHISTDGSYF